MDELRNRTIGVAADRQARAIATLIEKHGGSPFVRSIQGKRIYNRPVCMENVTALIDRPFDWVVLTTGIGARTLETAATELNKKEQFLETLRKSRLAIRGSKTRNWLKSHRLVPERISPDGTMAQLLATFEADGKTTSERSIYLQLYDEDEAQLSQAFETLGYTVYLSRPYLYQAPDPLVLEQLTASIVERTLDAVVFTSKTQVRNLFNQPDQKERLIQAFNDDVLAVAIGKVTGKAISDQGVGRVIQPETPKMGAMIVTLGKYYDPLVR